MNIKKIYGMVLKIISVFAGVDFAKRFDTGIRDHKRLNLKNPKTLSDKVSYIELHEQSPLASMCTDKLAVREFVKSKGLTYILVPLVGGGWEKAEDIDFDFLPESFVLKATHGCKMNYIVSDKNKLNVKDCRKKIRSWLSTTYGSYSMELHYLKIPHRVYAEQFLENADKLIEYKFHCMNGMPQFVLACSGRVVKYGKSMQVVLDLFDMDWQPIFELISSGLEKPGDGTLPKPSRFEEMAEIARKLSEDFQFVRVDLYEIEGKIYFGELTFSPAHCVFPYFTDEFDLEMGRRLNI